MNLGCKSRITTKNWVGSSVGLERMPDTHEVEGSSPSLPTKHKRSMIVSQCPDIVLRVLLLPVDVEITGISGR